MEHVGAVEALALHDERLRPDHLLRGRELHRSAQHLAHRRVLEPFLVDRRDRIAGAEDDVDEILAADRLAEPVRIREFGVARLALERGHRALHVHAAHEHVEVLGVALDAREMEEGVGASDEKRHLRALEPLHDIRIKCARTPTRFILQQGLHGHADCSQNSTMAEDSLMTHQQAVRLAAVGDLHVKKTSQGQLAPWLAPVNERADILLLCGDLTDYGLPEEAQILAKELASAVRIPIIAVLGNHDYESGQQVEVCRLLTEIGVKVLDGEACDIAGIGFAGVKGFPGGFGRGTLGAWGEVGVKQFVQAAVDEAMKLESALARLRTLQRVAMLHYSPIRDTVEGEPLEIYPYLGTSRLEEPLNRYPVNVVFHGHAHHGALEGRTTKGTPVFNVAMPLLLSKFPDRPPFRVFEMPAVQPAGTPVREPASEPAHVLDNG